MISERGFTSSRSRLLNCTTLGMRSKSMPFALQVGFHVPPGVGVGAGAGALGVGDEGHASAPASTTLRVDLCITWPGTVNSLILTGEAVLGAELDRQEVEVEGAVVGGVEGDHLAAIPELDQLVELLEVRRLAGQRRAVVDHLHGDLALPMLICTIAGSDLCPPRARLRPSCEHRQEWGPAEVRV